jgi:CDGSH-type Zn-finger protein
MKKKKFANAENKPFILEMKTGKYAWCSCGESRKQPFCDGSHGSTGMFPRIEIVPDPKTVAWCGCKSTQNPPFCDGTHTKFEK